MDKCVIALALLSLVLMQAVAASDIIFYESFDTTWAGRWIVSERSDYEGIWTHDTGADHNDFGLLVSQKAKKYGIAVDLPETVDPKEGTVVLQYELRLQNGLECGGAYLKFLLPQEAGWTPSQFNNESPYSIMFGPDHCGTTNKVHFIFRHKSPTDAYVEHHLKNPPQIVNDKNTHVYTAIIYENSTVQILIDGEVKKTAELLSKDFDPPVVPPKTIPDPEDKKPEDWDERAKIPDADATKPDDWDESAPREIEDLDAVKPEDWLDDEPDEVDDPDAVKPEDWDDEEDGQWEPPKMPNPKCDEASGCGEWKRPSKRNPAYKGKWSAPLIDNPDYQGIWKPQEIDNPDYFELEKPNLEPIAAIGIEIWTMQDGILFDNILVTRDEGIAQEYRDKNWKPKFELEKEKQKSEEPEKEEGSGSSKGIQGKVFDLLHHTASLPILSSYKKQLDELIEKGKDNVVLTFGILGGIPLVLLALLFNVLFGRKNVGPVTIEEAKKADISGPDDTVTSDDKEESKEVNGDGGEDEAEEPAGEIEKEGEVGTRRRSRRET